MPYTSSQFLAVLVGLGYATGGDRPEGETAAIQAFQQDYALRPTGEGDRLTQERARQLVRNLKHSLNLVVEAQLPISEFYDGQTQAAVAQFQAAQQMPLTGIADRALRQALEEQVKHQLRRQVSRLVDDRPLIA
ncbi:MAG: peptidoglycan-binding protein [Kaiparowitsia implicata GSE-PSE-MK54-09C]|jgi:peptidoglycan hydrolase-like protein with peptidoglycan-binding domain|nr:peptidoglycan-binding protein [Kaiparowitsia implicata GSE-PSE-MK54-09C]